MSATGQLYGSVNAATVAEELAKKGIEVDRKIITMKDAKKIGEYEQLFTSTRRLKSRFLLSL